MIKTTNLIINGVLIAAGIAAVSHPDQEVRFWAALVSQSLQGAVAQLAHRYNEDGTSQSVGFTRTSRTAKLSGD